jgi:hypothetical protein
MSLLIEEILNEWDKEIGELWKKKIAMKKKLKK